MSGRSACSARPLIRGIATTTGPLSHTIGFVGLAIQCQLVGAPRGVTRHSGCVAMNGLVRRLTQLYIGLILYGASCALMVRARLGLDPWDVFHQGVSRRIGWSIGTVVIVVGVLVLLAWIPLRQLPGLGTVSNVV